jgi:hypothetical protein
MEQGHVQRAQHEQEEREVAPSPSRGKTPWQEPKLVFVEPKLTKHGELENVTGGFFGTIEPPLPDP